MIIYFYYSDNTCAAPTITNGYHTCGNPTPWLEECTATCNTGFHMIGKATMTCNVDKMGSNGFNAIPTCIGIRLIFN